MIHAGKKNTLCVAGEFPFGFQLVEPSSDDASQSVMLPQEYAPDNLKQGESVTVFVGTDEQGQLIAYAQEPKLQVNQFGLLTAVGATHFGAFFDWGLPSDLLVPEKHLASPVSHGMQAVVYVFYDNATHRLLGSTKLHHFLSDTNAYLKVNQSVSCLVYAKTELGYKVVIDGTTLGLIFHSDALTSLRIGDELPAFVKHIREDGKIDIALQKQGQQARDALQQAILDDLEAHAGLSTITDKSKPEEIFSRFSVSKGAYKKALGALYKQKLIDIQSDRIKLINTH